jgi:hypothetical protein
MITISDENTDYLLSNFSIMVLTSAAIRFSSGNSP